MTGPPNPPPAPAAGEAPLAAHPRWRASLGHAAWAWRGILALRARAGCRSENRETDRTSAPQMGRETPQQLPPLLSVQEGPGQFSLFQMTNRRIPLQANSHTRVPDTDVCGHPTMPISGLCSELPGLDLNISAFTAALAGFCREDLRGHRGWRGQRDLLPASLRVLPAELPHLVVPLALVAAPPLLKPRMAWAPFLGGRTPPDCPPGPGMAVGTCSSWHLQLLVWRTYAPSQLPVPGGNSLSRFPWWSSQFLAEP